MTMPAINLAFHRAPGFIDPRFVFTRATTGTFVGKNGLIQAAPANTARFAYDPITLNCLGYLSEPQRTNLLLRSQEFDNAAWTKTNITVTANSTAAPDGTSTADTLAATGTGGTCAQAATITAGRGTALSFFLKANASGFAFVGISDGTNLIIQWFNLAAGTKGSQVGGGGTNLFAQATIEPMKNGWCRCSIETTTATITTITAIVGPCAADGADTANGNSIYAWGAQLEADSTGNSPTSVILTTSATVTRNADNLTLAMPQPWFNDRGVTIVLDVVNLPTPPVYAGIAQPLYGGFGDNAFVDVIYIYRVGTQTIRTSVGSASGAPGGLVDKAGVSWAASGSNKIGVALAENDLSMVINGGTPAVDSSVTLPVAANLLRMSVGSAPWAALSAATIGATIFRSWQVFARRVTDADLISLTAQP